MMSWLCGWKAEKGGFGAGGDDGAPLFLSAILTATTPLNDKYQFTLYRGRRYARRVGVAGGLLVSMRRMMIGRSSRRIRCSQCMGWSRAMVA